MKVKEFYNKIPSTTRNIMGTINSTIMSNLWSTESTLLGRLSPTVFASVWERDINPMLEICCEMQNIDIDNLTAGNMTTIVGFMFSKYVDKWTKLYTNVYQQEYEPLWNVDATESLETWTDFGKQTQETKNLTTTMNKGSTVTDTVTNNITENDVYGFNSATAVPANKSTNNGTSTSVGSGSDSDVHTGTDTFVNSGRDHYKEEKTRHGNIGVTKPVDLMESEIEMRSKFMYYETVMKDVISELTLGIYN